MALNQETCFIRAGTAKLRKGRGRTSQIREFSLALNNGRHDHELRCSICQMTSFALTAKLRPCVRCPEWEGWDILLDSIEFVQTPVIPLEGVMGTGSIYPPTPSHKVDNQLPQSMVEMNSIVGTFNNSAISRESAYMHLKEKLNNEIRAVD